MNGYKAFWKGKTTEVYAATTYEAQRLAAAKLGVKPKKNYEVAVVLCEKDGVTVTHNPGEIG